MTLSTSTGVKGSNSYNAQHCFEPDGLPFRYAPGQAAAQAERYGYNMEITLPAFDTGLYEGSELHMTAGGAVLTVHIAERPDFSVRFNKVRWHQFTALPNCTDEMVRTAYFKVVEVEGSRELADFLKMDRSSQMAYKELHHFRMFLDETGCHEFLAESANA